MLHHLIASAELLIERCISLEIDIHCIYIGQKEIQHFIAHAAIGHQNDLLPMRLQKLCSVNEILPADHRLIVGKSDPEVILFPQCDLSKFLWRDHAVGNRVFIRHRNHGILAERTGKIAAVRTSG